MRIPIVGGVIDRRILANYRIDPSILARILPAPFRPQIINGWGIGGICLIRLKNERPRFLPAFCGFSSENAAHRFAVEWDDQGEVKSGVYIPRRDTSSRLMSLIGGRIFPGEQHFARFAVSERDDRYEVAMTSEDRKIDLSVKGNLSDQWPATSVFASLEEGSGFFRCGSTGYSATCDPGRFDAMELCSTDWRIAAMNVESIHSSYFEETSLFPQGSVEFDCALLMRNIVHEWHERPMLRVKPRETTAAQ